MKTQFRFMFVLLIVALLSACSPVESVVQVDSPSVDVLDVILAIAIGFGALAGVAKLNTVLVQVGKFSGIIKDGTSDAWAAGFNIAAFGALVYFGVFQPDIMVTVLDGYAAKIAEILLFVLGFLSQITGSQSFYDALKRSRVPVLNYSHPKA